MVKNLTDEELVWRLHEAVKVEKRSTADVIELLAEFDRRQLHAKRGHSQLFYYCTRVLGYSEDEACRRIIVARKSRQFQAIVELLKTAKLNLTAVTTLAPHLNKDNHRQLLESACGKTKREIEMIVANLAPRPDTRDCVRRAARPDAPPLALGSEPAAAPSAPPTIQRVEPSAPDRFHFNFTGSGRFLAAVERAKELLWHKFPKGGLEDVLLHALEFYLDRKDPDRTAERPSRPVESDGVERRRIPNRVRKEVWKRDGGLCVFTAPDGTRCGERGGLEYDHRVPWALGGRSSDAANIRLLCRTHNQLMGRRVFGEAAMRGRSAAG